MITVFHRGDAPQILAALTELGYAFTEWHTERDLMPTEARWAMIMHLREIDRLGEDGAPLTPTTTIDNALGRSVIAGDYPETVLAKLPRVHGPGPDGRCSCKTGVGAEVVKAALAPVCPECRAGKHRNCDGVALDEATDEIVPCTCPPAFGHDPAGREQ